MFDAPKNISIIFFCLLYSTTVFCQPFTYFNKKLVLDESNQLSVATIPHDNGYYTVGVFGFTHPIIYFTNIDSEGNIAAYHILDDSFDNTTIVINRQFIQTSDKQLVLTYQQRVPSMGSISDIILLKFTKEGQVLWKQQFGFQNTDNPYEVIQTIDNGFLIAGFTWWDGHKKMYVVKTDLRGNLEWENTYCLDGSTWCEALSIDTTIDGGYILGGVGKNGSNDNDMYVVKIDSLGNQLWDKTYGTPNNDAGCYVKTSPSGNYFITGSIKENNGARKNYYAELDATGEIISEKIQNIHAENSYALRDYEFIGDGLAFMGVAHYNKDGANAQPLLIRTDSEANILWTKPITIDENANVYITDFDKIEGGYVLTGYKFSPAPQYGWIVTIDEEGNFCEELGCVETVVDIENTEVQRHSVFLQISPNPVRERTVIQYQIPKDGVLKVYDYQGRLIDNWKLRMDNSHLMLDLENWTSGVYFYGLEVEGRRVGGGKLVVE